MSYTFLLLSTLLAIIFLIGIYYKLRSTSRRKQEEFKESKLKYRTNEEFMNREEKN